MTTIHEIIKILTDAGIEENEANVEVKLLLEHFAQYSAKDVILGKKLEQEKLDIIKEKALIRAKTREPIQYIIGYADFMGEKFIVNPSVLIPRDETEILVRKSIDIINENNLKFALDVGTGSGCIACMVAKYTDCQIIGLDVSLNALNTALDNASKLNLYNKAIFRKSDIFSNVKQYEKFDIIISNPPYIPLSQKDNLQKEVSYEPQSALFSEDENGVNYYMRISSEAPRVLNRGGYIAFELGINQAGIVRRILADAGFVDIEIIKDLAGIERVICAHLPS